MQQAPREASGLHSQPGESPTYPGEELGTLSSLGEVSVRLEVWLFNFPFFMFEENFPDRPQVTQQLCEGRSSRASPVGLLLCSSAGPLGGRQVPRGGTACPGAGPPLPVLSPL